ncbi:hypothetical protein [Algoriphagus confluentis]|uniref:hypothetical protein n=1 Tax=Algoriphagus confluentis TaxID=1697556 RepID=UPI0030C6646D
MKKKYPQLGIFWGKVEKSEGEGSIFWLDDIQFIKFFGKLAETKKQIPQGFDANQHPAILN